MRSLQRSLPAFLFASVTLVVLISLLGGERLAAEGSMADAVDQPLILSSQKPRLQDFLPGGTAGFTVSITNTGTVELQNINVTGAVTADCNRADLGTLAPGQSTSYICSTSGSGPVNASFLNELQVNGTAGSTTVNHRSNAYVKVLNPDLRISKTPRFQSVGMGGTAFYNISVLNTSDFDMVLEQIDDVLYDECDRDPSFTVVLPQGELLKVDCFASNIQAATASEITVVARNAENNELLSATDIAWIDLLSLEATLLPEPASIPEPGGLVTYTVEIVNNGSSVVTLTELGTEKFGDLFDPDNTLIESSANSCLSGAPVTVPPNGGGFSCSYVVSVHGQPSQFGDVLTAAGVDANSEEVTATANATVTITNTPASMQLTLGASPSFINPPSGDVTFSVQVKNTSSADALTITLIEDQFLGNLNGKGTCKSPIEEILPGFSYQCQFTAKVSGAVGDQKSRAIMVRAVDDDPTPETHELSDVVTVNVIANPERRIFMPSVTDDNDPVIEPNNSCVNAHNMIVNRQYFVTPPARYPADQDYFAFTLSQGSRVSIDLKNFVPRKGQLVVRYDNPGEPLPNCKEVQKRKPDLALNNTMDLGFMPAGRYFIQVINDGPSNITEKYELIVHVD